MFDRSQFVEQMLSALGCGEPEPGSHDDRTPEPTCNDVVRHDPDRAAHGSETCLASPKPPGNADRRNGFESAAPPLLNRSSTARLLGISLRTLCLLTRRGAIRHVRIGQRVLYDPADVRDFIESHKSGGTH